VTTMSNRTTTCDVVGGFLECTATSCPGCSAQQEPHSTIAIQESSRQAPRRWGRFRGRADSSNARLDDRGHVSRNAWAEPRPPPRSKTLRRHWARRGRHESVGALLETFDLRSFFGGDLVPDFWRLSGGVTFDLGGRPQAHPQVLQFAGSRKAEFRCADVHDGDPSRQIASWTSAFLLRGTRRLQHPS
jgi:hypothetical protein